MKIDPEALKKETEAVDYEAQASQSEMNLSELSEFDRIEGILKQDKDYLMKILSTFLFNNLFINLKLTNFSNILIVYETEYINPVYWHLVACLEFLEFPV